MLKRYQPFYESTKKKMKESSLDQSDVKQLKNILQQMHDQHLVEDEKAVDKLFNELESTFDAPLVGFLDQMLLGPNDSTLRNNFESRLEKALNDAESKEGTEPRAALSALIQSLPRICNKLGGFKIKESTHRRMKECEGYAEGDPSCPCRQDGQPLDTDVLPEEALPEADQSHCDARTQKKADEPGKPKFKFSGGTCEVGGCASGYMPNKEKTGCIQMPKN